MRELIRGYDWPWRVKILDEDFTDGRVANTPKWTILSGKFRAEHGIGLHSVIQAKATQQKQNTNNDDLAAQLLNQLLKQAISSQGGQTQTTPTSALIHVATPIANAFALETAISSSLSTGRFEMAVYQREPGGAGYRLAYNPGARPSLELLRVGSRGTSVIDAYYETITLNDSTPCAFQWTREDRGEMVVSFGGVEVIRATDRGLRDAFDGLALSNLGGDFSVRNLRLTGMR